MTVRFVHSFIIAMLAAVNLMTSTVSAEAAQKRFALIIGNSAYSHIGKLANATNDARLMADALKATGFEVKVLLDLNEDAMGAALDDLAGRAPSLDVAVLYYAGHGIQKSGKNFLIPVDARLRSETAVERETIGLQSFMDVMSQVPISMIFLDACRNNPVADAMIANSSSSDRSAGVKRGLAIVRTRGDMLVAFATLPNSVAYDGSENNSPFARALARHVRTPDTEVSVILKRVTRDVMTETDGKQRPQQLSQMQSEFYFATSGKTETPVEPVRETIKTVLAVYPGEVKTGDEVSVLADVPGSCQPAFFNFTPQSKATPIPTRFFKLVDLGNGQTRYEISPGSRYGLIVQENDVRGRNRIGFYCQPRAMDDAAEKLTLLQALNARLRTGELSGTISTVNHGKIEYRFAGYDIK